MYLLLWLIKVWWCLSSYLCTYIQKNKKKLLSTTVYECMHVCIFYTHTHTQLYRGQIDTESIPGLVWHTRYGKLYCQSVRVGLQVASHQSSDLKSPTVTAVSPPSENKTLKHINRETGAVWSLNRIVFSRKSFLPLRLGIHRRASSPSPLHSESERNPCSLHMPTDKKPTVCVDQAYSTSIASDKCNSDLWEHCLIYYW